MKSTKSLIALGVLAVAATLGSSAFAETRADVQADLQAYNQSGLANFWHGDDAAPNTASPEYKAAEQRYEALRGQKDNLKPVSRADVQADLKAYQESGLADMTTGNRDVDEFSPQYQNAVAKYHQLLKQ